MLRAMAAAKQKNDRIEAGKIADLPEMRSPAGVLHGTDRDTQPAPLALSQPGRHFSLNY
jgi:hypothetical protein